MGTLPLTGIVDVTVNVSAVATIRETFDTALIVGDSTVISTADRVKKFTSIAAVAAGGFATSSLEYKAASLYFAQSPSPQSVYIGVKGSGETLLEAVTACRNANYDWYVVIPTEDLVADLTTTALITALATYIESAVPSSMLALTFRDQATYIANVTALKSGAFKRTFSQYDNVDANEELTSVAGIIGYAMGNNTTTSKAFTLAYKSVTGLTAVTTLTSVQLAALLDLNCNIYINQATSYNLFRQGKVADGSSFDEIMYLDMFVEQIKYNIMYSLTTLPKIPQTDAGITMLTNSISNACDTFVTTGFIAPGIWTGATILSLNTGDALSAGYLVQFQSLADQAQVDREARIAPNCYVCAKLAGAIEHVVIGISVNR